MQKIKKGDTVTVIAGKDSGKQGQVLKVIKKDNKLNRVVVEGINLVKKHTRENPNKNQQGGIVSKEMSIHASNVAIYNTSTGNKDKVGFKNLQDGQKVRYYKSSGEIIDK